MEQMKRRFMFAVVAMGCMTFAGLVSAQAPPVVFADFEDDTNGWGTEEHATDMIWVDGEDTAGPGSLGAISALVDPTLPSDNNEAKISGVLPEGTNMADYDYISFYYRCSEEAYTGNAMFVMPMSSDWGAGGTASHAGTMIGDNQWHYEEYHRDEFSNLWGDWSWDGSVNFVIGIYNTGALGNCEMYYDQVMLFNAPGDGLLLTSGGAPEVALTIPERGTALNSLDEITINFNQDVQGVALDGSDLLVNGVAATAVTAVNARRYTFTGLPEFEAGAVDVELQTGSIQSLDGTAFAGLSYSLSIKSTAPPTVFADFEEDVNGFRTEEHAIDLIWVEDNETAGPASFGAISAVLDAANGSTDDSPEGKLTGPLPAGVSMGDYAYISFYYRCNNDAYTGSTMFIMSGGSGWGSGGGADHSGTMIADNQWHYEEYHRDEFASWWGGWTWEDTFEMVVGFRETETRGVAEVWLDHVMLHNNPGDGVLLAASGPATAVSSTPANAGSVSVLRDITIGFDQVVQGVATDGSNLLVNGQPATAATTENNRTFIFSGFPMPGVGTVTVEVLAGSIQSGDGSPFSGHTYTFELYAPKGYEAPFAGVAPMLDGVISAGEYTGAVINSWTENLGEQEPVDAADWTADWTATHDADYVYVAFRATDDVLGSHDEGWGADNVEMFIDGPNLKTGTGNQFRANWNGTEWTSSAGEDWEWAADDTGNGWIVEARFSKETLEIPADGVIGFNIQPSDNDDGTRGTYLFWEDSPNNNNPWNDASGWGNMTLLSSGEGTSGVSDWSLYE